MEDKYSSKISELTEPASPFEKFAKKVFDKLISEGVPPLPSYYRVYFFNMLEEEPAEFRKQIYEIISLEESNDLEKDFEKEKKLKLSFKYTKELLQHSALIYKTSKSLKELLIKQLQEIEHITSPKILQKIIAQFENKLDLISSKLEKENKVVKDLFSKTVEIIKDIESHSTFDSRYGLYNKNYFIKLLEKEINLISKFSHISSLVVVKLNDKILNNLSQKGKIVANRSLAKMLLRTSRRTDEIGYLGDNIFGMLLKHTDKIGAMKTIERISDMLLNATIFMEGEEIELSIVAGIVEIKEKKEAEEYVKYAISYMKEAEKEEVLYKGD
ncbi:diguanylate cyclase [Caminibacter mediatlanticus TB-2]|uniref:Diguanylate cyclase n=1 Tax=Caminibacter mediatlanticus TB-2 TaxID=391592 RepID=A0AAI9F298_9BACT|nr:diguanylate cyclase [Caminibacter mediatlanticus]EDM23583.1 diguanylate cyclase (GGDEF domain) [Caminibacter mediatlanticus TB-2]QCT93880.1 diguanylate cyclase [Caminibacter mediatlanticus TB-2]